MQERHVHIPRTLNAPPMIFMFHADNIIIIVVTLVLTGLMNIWYIGLVMAYFLSRFWRELKEFGGRGLMVRFLYWHTGLFRGWINIPSHVREYLK